MAELVGLMMDHFKQNALNVNSERLPLTNMFSELCYYLSLYKFVFFSFLVSSSFPSFFFLSFFVFFLYLIILYFQKKIV